MQEYARDVGLKTDLVTMNPSVVQRAFEDLVNATWREKLLQRLHSLNGSILWIPAFMARGGKQRVESSPLSPTHLHKAALLEVTKCIRPVKADAGNKPRGL